ncbi:hypothetical protein Ahy_B09g096350 isoform L [Arachis hypogaea]|uniref:Uncharacterized protein n=1 Tax=Arachis hypogaea TaxID=3818 RepID=A0A444XK41_ARAHY|nr:hypothetical protein Ahy_B09g096350 isoform L [Arachis hypogaea]
MLFRASVYTAVVSGVCILAWYGRNKAKAYVEANLLPSVCLAVSEYIERDLQFGKVRRISPLSITLESCSFGPHKEEFSCGEAPTVKLRLHPFASLRSGKFVVDAVLSQPSVLVVQKKDYTWLGIPPPSEDGLQRHLSTEEGIDYRTRTRRIAREGAVARWTQERDDAAREAAQIGYFVSEPNCDDVKEIPNNLLEATDSKSFFCTNEGKHDHHCMDTGVDYNTKHAALEKSFGVRSFGFFSRIIKGHRKQKFKRKPNKKDICASGVAVKRRILERSGLAAHKFFQDQSPGKFGEPPSSSGCLPYTNHDMQLVKTVVGKNEESVVGGTDNQNIVAEHVDDIDALQSEGLSKMLPVTLDSVHFRGATVMLLAYGDREAREMENVNGHVKLNNHYSRVNVQLSGNCKTWRSDVISEDGGWLSADVYVDIIEQKWHANLKIDNFFVPLFERILEIPVGWSEGRASGEVHLCMSKGENFPNLHGQLDVTGLNFQLLDAPSCFSNISASLCFRGQRIFLHNANGWFGSVPLEASGDFGIHPEEGEFHLMCQVPGVEVNALMRTFKMRPLLFPLAGSVTALFNCQGPLDTPVFVGTGMVSRTFSTLHDTPESLASEALAKSKEAGALAAFDRIPFSYASANFTFNTDNCVADLYGIRATLVDGGEIRGAGNAWLCPEGEEDETAIDVNLSGSLAFEKILLRYLPNYHHQMPLKFGVLNGETKLSGALLRPRFDIKWTAPKAVGSFSDARGDIIISHDFITVNSASAAFDLYMKVLTSYSDDFALKRDEFNASRDIPFTVDGIELDLRMRGFEFFSLVSTYTLDFPRPLVLKSTGRIKFHGKVLKPNSNVIGQNFENNRHDVPMLEKGSADSLVGDISISDLKLNQLMLAPQLSGQLRVSSDCIKLDASGRPDESLAVEFVGPLQPSSEDGLINGKLLSISLQKGQLRVNAGFQPFHSANLEVRQFPLDELELASLRGTIQRAEIQLNLQKRRGHGLLSVLRPKFSGVLGEALDVAARWSGDVITIEKAALEQSYSHYELQGEYVLPGSRDRNPVDIKGDRFIKKLMSGHLGSFISSMGRWRMKLEVPRAEVAEMLPLARLLSRSTDPAVLSRSKDFFIQGLQTVGLYSANLQQLLELIRGHHVPSQDVVLEDLSLPGLSELKGRWRGSLDASGGGNGDTLAEFDFHGEDWEWGEYKTQRVLAIGAYSNDDGLHLEKIFIQKDNATVHADGTLLGPKTNLHFAVLNFPVSLVPTVVQVIESTATDLVHSLRQLLAPIRGILHMEGDLRGSLAKPECDVQVRLLDGAVGGIDLGRAEIVASLTSTSRFVFNAKLEPIIQNGHVLVQGSIPVAFVQNNTLQQDADLDKSGFNWVPEWVKERNRGTGDDANDKKASRDRNEEDWNSQITESLKGLNWQILDAGEVRVDADIKDGGMMLVTALSPYANWLHGNADVMLEVRGTVDQPVLNGYASFHRASISSPVLRKPLTNFGGTVNVRSNRLSIASLESRVSRKGKLFVKGNLPLRTSEAALNDKIELKCEALEVRAKNILRLLSSPGIRVLKIYLGLLMGLYSFM